MNDLNIWDKTTFLEVKSYYLKHGNGFLAVTPKEWVAKENKINCTLSKRKKTFVNQKTLPRKQKEDFPGGTVDNLLAKAGDTVSVSSLRRFHMPQGN